MCNLSLVQDKPLTCSVVTECFSSEFEVVPVFVRVPISSF